MAEKTQMERPLMDGEANGDEGETKWYLVVPEWSPTTTKAASVDRNVRIFNRLLLPNPSGCCWLPSQPRLRLRPNL
jgi:hypothetical protein